MTETAHPARPVMTLVHGRAADRGDYQEARERLRSTLVALPSRDEVIDALLAGRLRMQDIPDRPDIVLIQDHIAQMGPGPVADRRSERLGRNDRGVVLPPEAVGPGASQPGRRASPGHLGRAGRPPGHHRPVPRSPDPAVAPRPADADPGEPLDVQVALTFDFDALSNWIGSLGAGPA